MAPKLKKKLASGTASGGSTGASGKPISTSGSTLASQAAMAVLSGKSSSPSKKPKKKVVPSSDVVTEEGAPPSTLANDDEEGQSEVRGDDDEEEGEDGADDIDDDDTGDDIEISEELLSAVGYGDEPVQLRPEDLAEIAAYKQQLGSWREDGKKHPSASEGSNTRKKDLDTHTDLHNKQSTFSFSTLVKNVLPPELAHQGPDTVADALLEVKSARLDCLGMEDTSTLECLTSLVHLHAQRNRIVDLSGLEFMLNLNVLLLRGNRIENIDALALLPIQTLDLAENNLTSLDNVTAVLPFETLQHLSLEDNPCTVSSEVSHNRDTNEKVRVYRNTVLSTTPFLKVLDGLRVSQEEVELNGMEGLDELLAMDGGEEPQEVGDDGNEPSAAAGVASNGGLGPLVARGGQDELNTNVQDEDFLVDDDDEVETGRKAQTGYYSSSSSSTAKTSSTQQQYIADGVISKAGIMSDELLQRYRRNVDAKTAMAAAAADYEAEEGDDGERKFATDDSDLGLTRSSSNRYTDPEDPPTAAAAAGVAKAQPELDAMAINRLSDPESLEDVRFQQRELRDNLRQMHTHQSHIATSHVSGMWRDADRKLDEVSERAAERRRRLQEVQDAPSAAYQAALAKLKQSAGGADLDKYRQMPAKKKEGDANDAPSKKEGRPPLAPN